MKTKSFPVKTKSFPVKKGRCFLYALLNVSTTLFIQKGMLMLFLLVIKTLICSYQTHLLMILSLTFMSIIMSISRFSLTQTETFERHQWGSQRITILDKIGPH